MEPVPAWAVLAVITIAMPVSYLLGWLAMGKTKGVTSWRYERIDLGEASQHLTKAAKIYGSNPHRPYLAYGKLLIEIIPSGFNSVPATMTALVERSHYETIKDKELHKLVINHDPGRNGPWQPPAPTI